MQVLMGNSGKTKRKTPAASFYLLIFELVSFFVNGFLGDLCLKGGSWMLRSV